MFFKLKRKWGKFSERLEELSPSGIKWYDKKRIRKLKAFIRILKQKETQVDTTSKLFEDISRLERIYSNLLKYYKTHDSKFAKDLQRDLPEMNIEAINKREEKIKPLIEQLEHIHSKINNEPITPEEFEKKRKILDG